MDATKLLALTVFYEFSVMGQNLQDSTTQLVPKEWVAHTFQLQTIRTYMVQPSWRNET